MARSGIRGIGVVAMVAAVTAFGAVAASGAVASVPGYQIVPGDLTTVGPGELVGGNAICPAGTSVLAGGESNSSSNVVLTDSFPLRLDKDRWRVFVPNTSTTAERFHAFAICATATTTIATTQAQVGPNGHLFTTSKCPPGTVLYGGGASTHGDMLLGALWPLPQNTTGATTKVTIRAICAS